MAVLKNYQFELGGVVFGIGAAVATNGDGFNPGDDDITTYDQEMQAADALAFGVDSRKPAPWTFAMHTDMARFPDVALADAAALEKVWRNAVAKRTGEVLPLRYRVADRTRVVFGRPRHWSGGLSNRLLGGFIPIDAEFQRADTLFYDDDLRSTLVTNEPVTPGGLVSPIVSPIVTLARGQRLGTIDDVGGDEPAPFIAEITAGFGPAVNPKLWGDGWEIELIATIPAGMSVTVDTHPWGFKAIRSDGANLSGRMGAKTRFSKARLSPDGETLNYSAVDSSGTSRCTITWRPTFSTI